jgi:hypothetical protein
LRHRGIVEGIICSGRNQHHSGKARVARPLVRFDTIGRFPTR